MKRGSTAVIVVLSIVALLVAVRIAMPFAIERYVNNKLATLDAYSGRIGDVDVALWRGAYNVDDIVITKKGTKRSTPFFRADEVDFSIEWNSLLKGSIVSEATFSSPELNLVQSKGADVQLGQEENWNARLEELFPTRFNTITVENGTVTFSAPGIATQDAITARRVNGTVSNLTNVVEANKTNYADFQITAAVLDGAPAKVAGSVAPLAAQPTFDVNFEVKKVKLPQVNPWLREYIKADAEAGDFELYLEIAAAEGRFRGYAKPILQNVDLYRSNEQEQSALKRVWEGLLDFAAEVLENDSADQVAARIPFSGTIKNPETSLMETIASVLRNAFVSAFARSLEGSISLRDVKENLQGIDPEPRVAAETKRKPPSREGDADRDSHSARRPSGNPKL